MRRNKPWKPELTDVAACQLCGQATGGLTGPGHGWQRCAECVSAFLVGAEYHPRVKVAAYLLSEKPTNQVHLAVCGVEEHPYDPTVGRDAKFTAPLMFSEAHESPQTPPQAERFAHVDRDALAAAWALQKAQDASTHETFPAGRSCDVCGTTRVPKGTKLVQHGAGAFRCPDCHSSVQEAFALGGRWTPRDVAIDRVLEAHGVGGLHGGDAARFGLGRPVVGDEPFSEVDWSKLAYKLAADRAEAGKGQTGPSMRKAGV